MEEKCKITKIDASYNDVYMKFKTIRRKRKV